MRSKDTCNSYEAFPNNENGQMYIFKLTNNQHGTNITNTKPVMM